MNTEKIPKSVMKKTYDFLEAFNSWKKVPPNMRESVAQDVSGVIDLAEKSVKLLFGKKNIYFTETPFKTLGKSLNKSKRFGPE